MLEYDRIDIASKNWHHKTNASKEYDICHHWYFLDKNFKCKTYLCNGNISLKHIFDLMQKAINFNDVAIASVKGSDYRIQFWWMMQ